MKKAKIIKKEDIFSEETGFEKEKKKNKIIIITETQREEKMQQIAYYPEYTYYFYKKGKKPCSTVELLILKENEKYIVIASELISIRKDIECKQSLTNSVEHLIKNVFNQMKKENPQLKLENFIWIEHLYERGDHDTLPEEFSLVTPSNVMFDSKGYISSLKPSWLYLIMDDMEPEKRKGIPLEEVLKRLKELKIL